MVDQFQPAFFVDLGEQCHFGVGRAALYQCAAGVVAHAAQDGRTDAGRADNRMRFASQGFQQQFKLVQGRAGQADDLFVVVDGLDDVHPHGVHNHDVAVVIVAVGGRTAGQSGIRRLRNHNHVCFDARLQNFPHFQNASGANHRQRLTLAEAVTLAVLFGFRGVGNDVFFAYGLGQS
ncbi:Uncharacterised protein [Neisseria meningitidis]|nr:Uncharacterised protein [Neisseria meningitidis]